MKRIAFLLLFLSFCFSLSALTDSSDSKSLNAEVLDDLRLMKEKAWTHFNQKQYEEAEDAFRLYLAKDSDDLDIVIALGRSLIYQGILEEGLDYFNHAIELSDSEIAWFFRGYTYYQMKLVKKCLESYEKAIEKGYEHFDVFFNIGHIHYSDSNYKEAEQWFRKAIDKNESYPSSWYYLGLSKYKQRKDGYYEFVKVIELDPEFMMAYIYKGLILDNKREYQAGLENFEKALELAPEYLWAYYYSAQDLERTGKSRAAVDILETAVAKDLVNAEIYDVLADSYWSLREYDSAEIFYNSAVEISPDKAWVWSNRGYFLKQKKRYHEAIPDFEKAIELSPDWASPYNYLGNTYNSLNQYKEALPLLEKAVELAPEWSWPWNNLGNAQAYFKRYDEAAASYDKSSACDPNYHYPHYNKGIMMADLERYEEAIISYRKALEIDPRSGNTNNNLSTSLMDLKRYDEALEVLNRGLSFKPDHLLLHYNRGKVHYLLSNHEDAVKDMLWVIKKDNEYAYAYKYLGHSYLEMSLYSESVKYYRKASSLNSNMEKSLAGVIERLEKMGDPFVLRLSWNGELQEGLNITILTVSNEFGTKESDEYGVILVPRKLLTEGRSYYLYSGNYSDPHEVWDYSDSKFTYLDSLRDVSLNIKKKMLPLFPEDESQQSVSSPVLSWEKKEEAVSYSLTLAKGREENLEKKFKSYIHIRNIEGISTESYQFSEALVPADYLWTVTAFSKEKVPIYLLTSHFTITE
jgi:tetratricopeptide (TPR) repeat protein